jgi:hypothetical protein
MLLTAVRMWLDVAVQLRAESAQSYDDALYARHAQSILRGEWLGPFDHLTLYKAPGYPLWIAVTHALGIPLLIAQSALHAGAGLVFVLTLRRFGLPRVLAVALFALYLFDPFMEVRLLREGIYGSLLVVTVAAAAALSANLRARRPALWSALILGVVTAAAWLTREESVMVLPAIVIALAPAACKAMRDARDTGGRVALAGVLAAPALVVVTALSVVSFMNLWAYGVFRVNDQTTSPFTKAFGAVLSVRHPRPVPYLQVPPSVRGQIYRASPSFASLAPYIDGTAGSIAMREGWQRMTCGLYPHICGDYGGSWAMWVFRLAVSDAGHYRTAEDADRFLEGVASEIDAACRAGTLACKARRSSLLPPLAPGDLARIIDYVTAGTEWVLQVPVEDYVYDPDDRSPSSSEGARTFADLTGSPVRPPESDASFGAHAAGDVRLTIFTKLTSLYQAIVAPLSVLALVLFVMWVATCAVRGTLPDLLVVALALLVGFASRVALLGYVHAMLFPAFGNWPSYVTPLYPMLLLFVGVTLTGVAAEIIALLKARRAVLRHRPSLDAPSGP